MANNDQQVKNGDITPETQAQETEQAKTEQAQAQAEQAQTQTEQAQTKSQTENPEVLMTEEQLEALRALNEHMQNLNDQVFQAQEQAQKERARAEEYAKRLVNLQAEFDNYRRRNAESVKTAQIEGRGQVLIEVIKILDVIEQAMGMIKDDATSSGLKLVYRQVESILRNFDVQEIETEGMFDPNYHSAVELVKADDKQSGSIVEVVQKGYRLGEKILRYASVKVAQ
ncbi:MAG TPA: nucleotide exchange factor GrpE [Clostridia bacterium]